MRTRAVVASGVALLLAAGTGSVVPQILDNHQNRADTKATPKILRVNASGKLPSESAEDWVTYSDAVAVVSISDEKQRAISDWVKAYGEGIVGRDVTGRLERGLWERDGGQKPPASFSLLVAGWVVKDGKLIDFVASKGSRVEPGHKYIMPLARLDSGVWSPLNPQAVIAYDDDRIGTGEQRGGTEPASKVAANHKGKRADDLAASLYRTKPDPNATFEPGVGPEERFARAERKRTNPGETGGGRP